MTPPPTSQSAHELETAGADASERRQELATGAVVGRYVVLSRLGAGGMGVVFAAYDPELDRKVALKLLHPSARDPGKDRARLLREAQALARISHPNIVAVHDVGTISDSVFVAMEFIAGRTLGQWLRDSNRAWREIVDVFAEAGRGLAAAHAAGLVHRDFKPDNVMVGDGQGDETRGRVRVMDFGLARAVELDVPDTDEPATKLGLQPRVASLDEALTQQGGLTGTPAYMAPEQHAGLAMDARADQFSFCVALWEGLYGERPFRAGSLIALAAAVMAGELRPPPRGPEVPPWLRRVVERGLATDPDARWPSISALLEALARGRVDARRRRALAAVGAVALVGGGIYAGHRIDVRSRIAACETEGAAITEVWNDDARARVRAAMSATGISYAESSADKAAAWLDEHAVAWQRARTDACLDASVHHIWDASTLAGAQWCLDVRRLELEALVGELERADADVVEGAVVAAVGLTRIEPCRDAQQVARTPAPASEQLAEARDVLADLSQVAAQRSAGKYEQALDLANATLARSEQLGWQPMVAEARVAVGELLERAGHYEDAEAALEDAYFTAARAGALQAEQQAAEALAYTVGLRLARPADALRWTKLGEIALDSLEQGDGLGRASLLGTLAMVHYTSGDFEESKRLDRRALEIRESILGVDHPANAELLNDLATACKATGDFLEAKALQERVLAIRERTVGVDHPYYAGSLNNLANIHWSLGDLHLAIPLYLRALEIRERALGADHPELAGNLNNIGLAYYGMNQYDQAKAYLHRAIAILERHLGPDHPDLADRWSNLAMIHVRAGENAAAEPLFARALAILERSVAADSHRLANPHLGLAQTALARERPDEAVPHAEQALRLREAAGTAPHELALARFTLARALWESNRDRPRALQLAEQARSTYRETPGEQDKLEQVEAWLAERPVDRSTTP